LLADIAIPFLDVVLVVVVVLFFVVFVFLVVWLDRATIQFRFIGPNSGYTGSFCVFGPVLSSPAHGSPSLAMDQI
jgi:hypothetical protein